MTKKELTQKIKALNLEKSKLREQRKNNPLQTQYYTFEIFKIDEQIKEWKRAYALNQI